MLLNMDCFALRHVSKSVRKSRQHYLTADINRALHIHQTSLNLANDSRLFGRSRGKFLAVADGLGDLDAAARASTLAIDCVSHSLVNDHGVAVAKESEERNIEKRLVELVKASQEAMVREGEVLKLHRGMESRLGVAYVLWPNLYLVQVGSTHCLLLRNGWLTEWSTPLSDARDHAAVAAETDMQPQVRRVPLRLGDRVLMCSASIGASVSDFEIKTVMSSSETASEICESLTTVARKNGCQDCSLIAASFDEGVATMPQTIGKSTPVDSGAHAPWQHAQKTSRVSGKSEDAADRSEKRPAERPLNS